MGLQHLFAAVFYVREEGLVVAEHRDCNVRADFFEHSFQPLFMPQLFQREIQYLGYEGAVVGLVVDSEVDGLDGGRHREGRLLVPLVGSDDCHPVAPSCKERSLVRKDSFHSRGPVGSGYRIDYFHCASIGSGSISLPSLS